MDRDHVTRDREVAGLLTSWQNGRIGRREVLRRMGILGLSQHQAHGTSLAIIIPTAIAGAIRYYVAPRGGLEPPLELAVAYALPAMLGAPVGARLIQHLDTTALKRLFGVLLLALAVRLLVPRSAASLCAVLGLAAVPDCPSVDMAGTLVMSVGLLVLVAGTLVVVLRGQTPPASPREVSK